MTTPFIGYNGVVWSTVYNASQYFISQLEAASTPAQQAATVPIALAAFSTALFGLEAIDITDTINVWNAELTLLQEVEALPIYVPLAQLPLIINRITALITAIPSLQSTLPTIVSTVDIGSALQQGQPAISDPDYILWLSNFSFETPPSALSSTNFIINAQAVADAFNAMATQIQGLENAGQTSLYDVAIRFANAAQVTANILSSLTSGPIIPASLTASWNQLVSCTALLIDSALVTAPPLTLVTQQDMVIRYVILAIMNQLAQFLLAMRQPNTTQINQAILMTGQSLMDLAAQNTGNFENWISIAAANGLLPPYVGSTSSPGIASWGSSLILPNPGTSSSAVGATPSYDANYLGVDEYIGPINGVMPPWTGDYQLISGYNNLRWALGRRLQTTIGSLIYHSNYGCRIPLEVGNIQSANTVSRIAAFGKSALQQDPRVAQVLSAIAQSLPNFAIAFSGAVKPGGFGHTALSVNEVISPSTAPTADAT